MQTVSKIFKCNLFLFNRFLHHELESIHEAHVGVLSETDAYQKIMYPLEGIIGRAFFKRNKQLTVGNPGLSKIEKRNPEAELLKQLRGLRRKNKIRSLNSELMLSAYQQFYRG